MTILDNRDLYDIVEESLELYNNTVNPLWK